MEEEEEKLEEGGGREGGGRRGRGWRGGEEEVVEEEGGGIDTHAVLPSHGALLHILRLPSQLLKDTARRQRQAAAAARWPASTDSCRQNLINYNKLSAATTNRQDDGGGTDGGGCGLGRPASGHMAAGDKHHTD